MNLRVDVRPVRIGWFPIAVLLSCLAAFAGLPPSLLAATAPRDAAPPLSGAATSPLTAGERAKLDQARAAIEASRRAGTLFTALPAEPRVPLPEIDPALKLSRLHRWRPAVLRPDAAAGLSPDHRPVQQVGPSGLNAVEVAKRDGTPLPRTAARAPARVEEPGNPEGPRP